MSRCLAVLIFTALTVGCHGQWGNPFMRTTVPPPGTGAAVTSGEPYYSGGAAGQPPAVAPGQAVPPPAGAPPATPVVPPPEKRFSQPGGINFPQGSVTPRKAVDPNPQNYQAGTAAIARAARPRPVAGESSKAAVAINQPAAEATGSAPESIDAGELLAASYHEDKTAEDATETDVQEATSVTASPPRVVRNEKLGVPQFEDSTTPAMQLNQQAATGGATLKIVGGEGEVVPATATAPTASATPTASSPFRSVPSHVPAFTVAPPLTPAASATTSAPDAPRRERRYFDRARPVSYTASTTAGSGVVAATTHSNGGISSGPDGAPSYSHNTGYQWLRGKLEYSTASKRWKLRYIPIDGQTDAYGGSVILPNSPQLDAFRPGEFVTIQGAIGQGTPESGGFSPTYDVRQVERQ